MSYINSMAYNSYMQDVQRRYSTPAQNLNPAHIRFIGYWKGSFYVSEYAYRHFGDVLRDARHELTWIGSPSWFAHEYCKAIYLWLAARYDMNCWYDGEWMEICPLEIEGQVNT